MSKIKDFFRFVVLPPIIFIVYWFWSHTWRLKVIENEEFKEALKAGSVAFAFWHGDEIAVIRVGKRYHIATMTSTSSDGELMTRILRLFGFGISRGSSTRGGATALLGLIDLVKGGYRASVAVDGPKGPRHKAKPGVWALAKHANIPIVPVGAARSRALISHKSWNKTYLPLPFAKVILCFGKPLSPQTAGEPEELQEILEKALFIERGNAQARLLGGRQNA